MKGVNLTFEKPSSIPACVDLLCRGRPFCSRSPCRRPRGSLLSFGTDLMPKLQKELASSCSQNGVIKVGLFKSESRFRVRFGVPESDCKLFVFRFF